MSKQLEAIDKAVAAANRGDLDGYMQLYDSTVVLHGYAPEPIEFEGPRSSTARSWAPSRM